MSEPVADLRRETLLDQPVPPVAVARVEVRRITMPAGFVAGAHRHNGPVFGSVVHGSVAFRVDGGPATTLTAGAVFYEPADTVIAAFDAGPDGATFLAYFPLAEGQTPEITSA